MFTFHYLLGGGLHVGFVGGGGGACTLDLLVSNLTTSWLFLSKVHRMSLCRHVDICLEISVLVELKEIDIRF